MEILQFLPWVLIIIGVFYIAHFAQSSGRKLSNPAVALVLVLSILVPALAQWIAGETLAPPLGYTKLVWFFIDTFQMRGQDAQFSANVTCRTLGALVGIAIVVLLARFLLKRKLAQSANAQG